MRKMIYISVTLPGEKNLTKDLQDSEEMGGPSAVIITFDAFKL